MLTILAPEQQRQLAADVAAAILLALAAKQTAPRLAYSLTEVATLTGFSRRHVVRAVRIGALPTVRPGAGDSQRVLVEHLKLWLWGQVKPGDEPAMGPSLKSSARAAKRALMK